MSQKVSAAALARQLMKRHEGNRDKAIKAAMTVTQEDEELQREVLLAGWQQFMIHVSSMNRNSLMQRTHLQPVASRGDNVLALRSVMSRSFLETYDVLGIPLGKATPDDLRRSISSRKSMVATHTQRLNFETDVLKGCKPNKTVRQCWNDTDLENLAYKHSLRKEAA